MLSRLSIFCLLVLTACMSPEERMRRFEHIASDRCFEAGVYPDTPEFKSCVARLSWDMEDRYRARRAEPLIVPAPQTLNCTHTAGATVVITNCF